MLEATQTQKKYFYFITLLRAFAAIIITNCHNSLCAIGGTINADDHRFGLSEIGRESLINIKYKAHWPPNGPKMTGYY